MYEISNETKYKHFKQNNILSILKESFLNNLELNFIGMRGNN